MLTWVWRNEGFFLRDTLCSHSLFQATCATCKACKARTAPTTDTYLKQDASCMSIGQWLPTQPVRTRATRVWAPLARVSGLGPLFGEFGRGERAAPQISFGPSARGKARPPLLGPATWPGRIGQRPHDHRPEGEQHAAAGDRSDSHQSGWKPRLHSLTQTWKLPEGLCRLNQVFQKRLKGP